MKYSTTTIWNMEILNPLSPLRTKFQRNNVMKSSPFLSKIPNFCHYAQYRVQFHILFELKSFNIWNSLIPSTIPYVEFGDNEKIVK